MNVKTLGLLAVALLAGPIIANAQVEIINYQGTSLTVVSSTPLIVPDGFQTPSAPFIFSLATDPISGMVAPNTPLPLNGTTAASAELEIGGITMDGSSGEIETTNGVITGWSVSASDVAVSTAGDWGLFLTISSTGDSFSAYQDVEVFKQDAPGIQEYVPTAIQSANSTPGTWTIPQAPEIDPASAASGLTLFFGTLVVLRGRRTMKLGGDV